MIDEQIMSYVLQLALRGKDYVSPNPRVGAVIVKDNKIVAEGWHKKFGAPHAEIDAINNAQNIDIEGSTLYVNLEPCSHYGKTPPCVNAIIEKKFGKVVIGMQDPNNEVNGKGVQLLREAGIEVVVGVKEKDCRWLNRYFINHITTGLPYIIMKVAQSINGDIGTSKGESKWITSEESRKQTHILRSDIDAVLIGRNTAETDNPSLTVRDVKGKNPKRIVFDSNLSLSLNLDLICDSYRSNTIICCSQEASQTRKAQNLRLTSVKVIEVPTNNLGKINIVEALKILYIQEKIGSVLVEGGARIFSTFMKEKMYNELHIFIAPIIIGKGINSFGFFELGKLNQAPGFKFKSIEMSGPDIHITALRK